MVEIRLSLLPTLKEDRCVPDVAPLGPLTTEVGVKVEVT